MRPPAGGPDLPRTRPRELQDPAAARRRRLALRGLAGLLAAGCLVAGGDRRGERGGPGAAGLPAAVGAAGVRGPDVPAPGAPGSARVPANLQTGRVGGEWRTAELTRHDVAARLRADGVAGAAAFVSTLPAGAFRIRLSVYAGRVSARVDHALLDAAFLVRGDGSRVELRDMRSGRHASYVVRREGDRMRFSWLGSAHGRWHGYPPEVQRAVYTTAPFTPLE